MDEVEMRKTTGSSQTHDIFQLMFEGADLVSSVWQPLLKSIGRWHLEVAGLGVKQGQAALQFSRDLSRCYTAGDVASAQIRYWDTVSSQYAQSSQRMAATVARAAEQPLASEVVPLPRKSRDHDLIVLPGESNKDSDFDRKVA
ncbi:MAG TPA: hypothetical protein PLD46_07380 [Hyphomicrobium sp.]|nr:hypothetical protein [Hyphomicrobium sp.]